MKFVTFTDAQNGRKVAVYVDKVAYVLENENGTVRIWTRRAEADIGAYIDVAEDFNTVISRLNTIAE